MRRWKRLGLLASVVWVVVGSLLASWHETWIAAWKLYCFLATDPTCVGTTAYIVVHRGASIVLYPVLLSWVVAWGLVALRRRIGRSGRGG
jgi:hypothetical protein